MPRSIELSHFMNEWEAQTARDVGVLWLKPLIVAERNVCSEISLANDFAENEAVH